MLANNNNRKQHAKAVLLRLLDVIHEAVRDVRQGVDRNVPTSCSILASQRIRGYIAAFEVALIEARSRRLAAGAANPKQKQSVMDLAPFIKRQVVERSRRQGRI